MAPIFSPAMALRSWALCAMGRAAIAVVLAALWGCAEQPPPANAAAIAGMPLGAARIWVYREYEPFETLARPYVRINGRFIGVSEPGGAFYRDVAPGSYRVTVDTVGQDLYQFADVALAAGQTAFIKVESSKLWESSLTYRSDTFYTRLIPAEIAEAELARSRLRSGR